VFSIIIDCAKPSLKSRSARDRRHNGPLSQFEIFSLAIDIQLMRSRCGGVEDDLHRRSRDVTDISKRSELFQSGLVFTC
jgi:hypothetical protein